MNNLLNYVIDFTIPIGVSFGIPFANIDILFPDVKDLITTRCPPITVSKRSSNPLVN